MKNWLKFILVITISLGLLGFAWPIKATSVIISNITVTNIEDGNATIKWRTTTPTKGTLYYGESNDNLEHFSGYNLYEHYHSVTLNGLQPDKTYYYKILAYDADQNAAETFLLNFSTKGMKDTVSPNFIDKEILQTTGNAAALYWKTSEKTTATIHYGFEIDEMNKKIGVGGLTEEHEFVVRNLEFNKKYYLKIVAADKAGNTRTSGILIINTHGSTSPADFKIQDVQPINYDSDLVFANSVTIKFKTNFISKSYIMYGKQPGRYSTRVDINKNKRSDTHKITLMNLEPNTTYYYKIFTYDNIYGQGKQSDELAITTTPEQKAVVLGTKIISSDIDSDSDGLSDSYELDLGTNPNHYDSDRDGYSDGTEVKNGYNPLGAGKLGTFAYGKVRISTSIEQERAKELKKLLEADLGRPLNISIQHWYTVVNAYVYGEYPVHAIAQSIKFGGKTVHPTINWQSWKNSNDYRTYITR
ncbi:hypothetical protein C4566_03230 [Candidatus Parcubacteria bacterium]|nr:MAG: hypothetical protein C4566_03230 [Candidatus Parcubacteria bacterium]